jgi:PKD repeat protein
MAAVRIPLLTLGILLAFAAPALAVPVADYISVPTSPIVGEPATLQSISRVDPGRTIDRVEWDMDFNGSFEQIGSTVPLPTTTAGNFPFRMRVRDDLLVESAVASFAVRVLARPVAQFSFTPRTPVGGQEVLFESFSYDPDGTIQNLGWELDGDGDYNDDLDAAATRVFTTPGTYAIGLRVRDNSGLESTLTRTVTVGPAPADPLPVAQFAVSPVQPEVGQQVSLRSFSYDPNGALSSQRWDLDGDGDFDEDVHGKTVFTVFSQKGERIVRLEVRDSNGGVQTETQAIAVKPQSDDLFTSSGLALMNPFPVVRLAGSVYARGVRVRTLEAKAPKRSTVTVLCAGKSCPSKKIVKTAKRKPVRFKAMTRFLREGTTLSVSVRKGGQIGKYTRWLIRGGKLPKRKDLCLYPSRRKPARCPGP